MVIYQFFFPLRSIFIGMPLIMLLYVFTAVSYIAVLPVAQYDWAGSGQNAAVILFLAPQRGGGVGNSVCLEKKCTLLFVHNTLKGS